MKYRVTRTVKYTEDKVVDADSEEEAIALAESCDGFDRNHDDWIFDIEADPIG